MVYSIDTSALLDGWNRYYPCDVFPSLWDRFDDLIEAGELIASEEVLVELERKDDEVYRWAKKRPGMFVPLDIDIQLMAKRILSTYEKLVDTRAGRTAADPFVIAVAHVKSGVVITGEKHRGNTSRPNIPNVCDDMGIPWMNLLQLLRDQKWVFR